MFRPATTALVVVVTLFACVPGRQSQVQDEPGAAGSGVAASRDSVPKAAPTEDMGNGTKHSREEMPTPSRTPAELAERGQQQRVAGLFQEASATLEDARDQLDAQQSPDLVLRGEVLYQLGSVYAAQRRLGEATTSLQRALEDAMAVHGPNSYSVAVTKQVLGGVYDYDGKYKEAELMFRDAIALLTKLEGSGSLDVAQARANLALNLDFQNRDDAALAEYRAVLKAVGDRMDPLLGDVQRGIGSIMLKRGQFEKAETAFQRALAIHTETLGPEHPTTAMSLHNLAALYDDWGKDRKALQFCERSETLRNKVLGPDHVHRLQTEELCSKLRGSI